MGVVDSEGKHLSNIDWAPPSGLLLTYYSLMVNAAMT